MSSVRQYNQMAPFWDFIADLQERGHSHPFFARRGGGANRAANQGEAAEGNNEQPNPWTEGGAGFPFGPMGHRHGHGHGHRHGFGPGHRHGRRQQQAEAATAQDEKNGLWNPEAEKEVETEKVPFEPLQSEGENVQVRNGPGARRGGRGGRGGRGAGLGRGRGAAAVNRDVQAVEIQEPLQSDTEKTSSGEEAPRRPGPGRGGRGMGRGMGRGAGRGLGQGRGQGMGPGMRRGMGQRMGPGAGRVGPRALNAEMFVCPHGCPHGQHVGPRGGMLGAGRGMRGMRGGPGAGLGRGRGGNMAAATRAMQNMQLGDGPHRGPGAGRGGPGARGGRGLGAGRGRGAGLGRGRGAAAGPNGAALRPGNGPNGPNARRLNQGPAARQNQGLGRPGANKGPGGLPMGPRMRRLAAMFQEQLAAGNITNNKSGVFAPEVDIFDHPEAFVIHASLPGAKKDGIEVNWNSDKSELTIAGHIDRPGDEEFLKSLAMDERKVGAFERKVRLAGPRNPAQVVVDDITAKMEDGILKIEVPKLDASFVDVKKVDIN